jgi:hypothetical protein
MIIRRLHPIQNNISSNHVIVKKIQIERLNLLIVVSLVNLSINLCKNNNRKLGEILKIVICKQHLRLTLILKKLHYQKDLILVTQIKQYMIDFIEWN